MTTVAVEEVAESTILHGFWTRSRKAGIVYVVLGLLAAGLFGGFAAASRARFTFTENPAGAGIDIPGRAGAIVFGLVCVAVGVALLAGVGKNRFGAMTAVALVSFVLAFLCWNISAAKQGDHFMPLVQTAKGTLAFALPLIFGALAGVLCERSGVININIEGQFLMGAFAGALVGTMSASVWLGLIGAGMAGVLIAAVLAVMAIKYLVDQVVLGVVLNLFALGLTGFLYESLMQAHPEQFNNPPRFVAWRIPLLADIPIIGPAVFNQNVFGYLGLALVAVIYVGLFHTRWGLRVRAVGEHPTAADTVGIRVLLVRYRNVLLGGLVAGLGGAFFTLGTVGAFNKNMTAGKGFIALAALIFGKWRPTGALLAALFFGFAQQLADYLGLIGSPIPSQFLVMLPYLATIVAVAGLVGKVRAPAADGKPYVKG